MLAVIIITRVQGGSSDTNSDQQISFECMNPLFRGHWFTNRNDAAHLSDRPIAYTDLVRCRMWNYHASCCTPSMEASQQLAFDSRKAQLETKTALLESYAQALTEVADSAVYSHSDVVERALFDRALNAVRPALHQVADCTHAILEFVAGMICWGCNPRWSDFVWRDDTGTVVRVNIDGEACIYISQRCSPFGRAALDLNERVLESRLAKQPTTSLPDWSMLADRETLCEWLRSAVAMQPLPDFIHAQSGAQPRALTATGGPGSGANASANASTTSNTGGTTTTTAPPAPPPAVDLPSVTVEPPPRHPPTAPPYATSPRYALDPVHDGRQSGFSELRTPELDTSVAPARRVLASKSPKIFVPTTAALGGVCILGTVATALRSAAAGRGSARAIVCEM